MGHGSPVHRSKRKGKNGKVPGRVKGGVASGDPEGPPKPSAGRVLMEQIRRRRQVFPLRWLRRRAKEQRERAKEEEVKA